MNRPALRRRNSIATLRQATIESLENRRLLSAAIASGQTISASISAKAEVDTYTINGVAGGSLMATVGETVSGSALSPLIKILGAIVKSSG